MTIKAFYSSPGSSLKHTPAAALSAGEPIQIALGRAGVPSDDIAASILGNIPVAGIFEAVAAAVAGNVDDPVGWDSDGDPVGGEAGSGAVTTNPAAWDFPLGCLARPLAATDGRAFISLNVYAIDRIPQVDKVHEVKSANYTVDAQDAGKVIGVDTDGVVITLPAAAAATAGLEIDLVNLGANGTVGFSVSPNANDKIMGPDIAGVDDKDYINTKATAVKWDRVRLRCDGSNGWWIVQRRGTWAAQA